MRMFSVPASAPLTGADVRLRRSMRWISWLRYQPYPAAAPAISTSTSRRVPVTQTAVRRAERFLGAAWAGPLRAASPPLAVPGRRTSPSCPVRSGGPRRSGARARGGPSRPGCRRGRPAARHRPRRRSPPSPPVAGAVDLAPERVQALLDGVVLGVGRAHGAVVCSTCDRRLWPTPVPPRRLRIGRPERGISLATGTPPWQSRRAARWRTTVGSPPPRLAAPPPPPVVPAAHVGPAQRRFSAGDPAVPGRPGRGAAGGRVRPVLCGRRPRPATRRTAPRCAHDTATTPHRHGH